MPSSPPWGPFGLHDRPDLEFALLQSGVEFLQEPAERPYGIEAVFRDDSGNWFSLTQRTGA